MVTTKQKPIVNTQRIKRKNYNHTTKEKVIKPQMKRARKSPLLFFYEEQDKT